MTKGTSSSPKKRVPQKSASVTTKPRTQTTNPDEEPKGQAQPPPVEVAALLADQFKALQDKLVAELASLISEVQALKTLSTPTLSSNGETAETVLPVIADLIRRNVMEQTAPIIASLKRLEERVGFICNRLKHPQSAQEQRPKPWRHDQQQRHGRPRGHGNRPPQGQTWAPPSAASVQGHFAPRPLPGGSVDSSHEDEE